MPTSERRFRRQRGGGILKGVTLLPALAALAALALLGAGCSTDLSALRQGVAAERDIYVVYGVGTVIARTPEGPITRAETPEAYEAVADIVRTTLARLLAGHHVFGGRPPAGGAGLEAVVSVHGGYVCEGEAPHYSCGLTVQSLVTFRSLRTGRRIGPWGNLIGQVWYGTHPLTVPAGGPAGTLAVERAVRAEIPATALVGPLESATEEGLAAFLETLGAVGG